MGQNSQEVAYGFGQLGSVFTDLAKPVFPPKDHVIVAIQFLADNTPTSTDNAYPYGTLLETTSIQYTQQKNGADSERGILYNVRKTQSANSKKVLGAYGGSMNQGPNNHTNRHQALVLGDGHILCNNSGGNISIGDGICSSSTAGIGQKATANPSMIIGIAQEDITFSGSETKLVPVQYGLQQFVPWS